jgi:hypothetical protein
MTHPTVVPPAAGGTSSGWGTRQVADLSACSLPSHGVRHLISTSSRRATAYASRMRLPCEDEGSASCHCHGEPTVVRHCLSGVDKTFEADYIYGRRIQSMLKSKTLPALALLLLLCSSLTASVQLRLEGGWPLPSSEFKSKSMAKAIEVGTIELEHKTSGEYSLTGEASIGLGRLPFDLSLASGIIYFDDENKELQETTYDHPLGTGRFTDFKHRIIPLTLGLEYYIGYAERTATTVGVGLGFYRYRFINRGDLEIEYPNSGNQTFFGWHIGIVQHAKISEIFGLCLDFDYHSISLGEDEAVGLTEAGFIKRITFYRIQLGVVIQVID